LGNFNGDGKHVALNVAELGMTQSQFPEMKSEISRWQVRHSIHEAAEEELSGIIGDRLQCKAIMDFAWVMPIKCRKCGASRGRIEYGGIIF
jgi:hypothetical protein